jgi:polyribonucleotide nucleotidyltransferase
MLLAKRGAHAAQAIRVGHEAVAEQCRAIEEWAAAVGQQKRTDFSTPGRDLDSQLQVCSYILHQLKYRHTLYLPCKTGTS